MPVEKLLPSKEVGLDEVGGCCVQLSGRRGSDAEAEEAGFALYVGMPDGGPGHLQHHHGGPVPGRLPRVAPAGAGPLRQEARRGEGEKAGTISTRRFSFGRDKTLREYKYSADYDDPLLAELVAYCLIQRSYYSRSHSCSRWASIRHRMATGLRVR